MHSNTLHIDSDYHIESDVKGKRLLSVFLYMLLYILLDIVFSSLFDTLHYITK